MNNETPSLPDASLLAHEEIAALESLALGLEAVDIEYRLEEATSTLWVAEEDFEAATEHLRLYMEENLDWPPVNPWNEAHPQTPPTVLVMVKLPAIINMYCSDEFIGIANAELNAAKVADSNPKCNTRGFNE